MTWSFDITKAPRGRYVIRNRRTGKGSADVRVFVPDRVILALESGDVIRSHYLPDEKRWLGCVKDQKIVAWQAWPEHPNAAIRAGEAA